LEDGQGAVQVAGLAEAPVLSLDAALDAIEQVTPQLTIAPLN
jgi:hypothetical protein